MKDNNVRGFFDITVNLSTEKGSNIVAGLLKMEIGDLSNSQGQNVNYGLYNCVDPSAKCQIRIVRLRKIKVKKDKSRLRALSGATSIRLDSNRDK